MFGHRPFLASSCTSQNGCFIKYEDGLYTTSCAIAFVNKIKQIQKYIHNFFFYYWYKITCLKQLKFQDR